MRFLFYYVVKGGCEDVFTESLTASVNTPGELLVHTGLNETRSGTTVQRTT